MAKKSKRSSSIRTRQLLAIKNKLRGAKNPLQTLSDLRETAPVHFYGDILSWISSNLFFRTTLFHPEFPQTLSELEPGPLLRTTDANREFRWAGARLMRNVSKLARFVSLSAEFQRLFLIDAYEAASRVLSSIEKEFGQSLWLVKNKISLYQYSAGLESQKRYTKNIFREVGISGVFPFIAFFVSVRNEPAVTPERFSSQFLEHLSKQNPSGETEDYIRSHVLPQDHLDEDAIAGILNYESAGTIIDLYESILRLGRQVVSAEAKNLYSSIEPVLRALQPIVNDHRASLLVFELSPTTEIPMSFAANDTGALESFLLGDHEIAEADALRSLQASPESFELMEIAARSAAIISKPSVRLPKPFYLGLVKRMQSVISKDSSVKEDMTELVKIALNFNQFPWATSILSFLRTEISSYPLETSSTLAHEAALDSNRLDPRHVLAFPSKATRQAYSGMIREHSGESLTSSYSDALVADNLTASFVERISREEGELLTAESLLRSNDVEGCLSSASDLGQSKFEYYQHRAIRLTAHCLLVSGRLDDSIEFLCSTFLTNQKLHYVLPIRRAVEAIEEAIEKGLRKRASRHIAVPILYDLYAKFVANKYDAERSYAYEDFLTENGMTRPSQIGKIISDLDFNRVVYFLRHLCVEPVMHRSIEFKRSREISEERVRVCRLLIQHDSDNVDLYQSEIRDTVQQLMIQKRIRQIEQSKIYVDTDSLRITVGKKLGESFNRYVSFLNEGLDNNMSLVQKVLDELQSRGQKGLVILRLPDNEMEDIFNNLIKDLRDEFVSSPEHGLDKYLSVRIRHGTLSGELRKPLETHKLITQRDHKTGKYKPNEYWMVRLGIDEYHPLKDVLNERLAKFGSEFDQFITHMLSTWIQIKKEADANGLFDFSLQASFFTDVSRWMRPETSFDLFLDHLFELFNTKLEMSLENIRSKIDSEAKVTVNQMLTALQTDLEDYSHDFYGVDTIDITNSIRAARTGMLNAFNRIADWFKLSKAESNEPFFVEDAVEISKETLRTSSQKFHVTVSTVNEENRFDLSGKYLTNFVDIFINIFQNIIKHSEIADKPTGAVTITYSGSFLSFHIVNSVGPGVASRAAKSKISTIKAAMQGASEQRFVVTEGGTGLHKIWRIISHDFKNSMPVMDFGFEGKDHFFVDFAVDTKGLTP